MADGNGGAVAVAPMTTAQVMAAIKVVATADVPLDEKVAAIEALVDATPPALNLAGKLATIMGQLSRFPKDQRVGGTTGYAFAGIDDMADRIRPLMAEQGVVMLPDRVKVLECREYLREKKGREDTYVQVQWRTVLRVRWLLTDGVEHAYVESVGEALDTSDKSANKAQSAARKYALIGLFNISTGDSPDPDSSRPGEGEEYVPAAQRREQVAARARRGAEDTPPPERRSARDEDRQQPVVPRNEPVGERMEFGPAPTDQAELDALVERGTKRWAKLSDAFRALEKPGSPTASTIAREWMAREGITKLWQVGRDDGWLRARAITQQATGEQVSDPFAVTLDQAAAAAAAAGNAAVAGLEPGQGGSVGGDAGTDTPEGKVGASDAVPADSAEPAKPTVDQLREQVAAVERGESPNPALEGVQTEVRRPYSPDEQG